jgi:hypothetical protein
MIAKINTETESIQRLITKVLGKAQKRSQLFFEIML